MNDMHYRLGSAEAAEAVIRDLYLQLRTQLFRWAAVTQQTPQPRMGYIGQHLTSVVTGFPGGRSGARGKDLILPGGKHAEIKTCYRVDQLGSCRSCGQLVASVEFECPMCHSDQIVRKDDSKWLIGPRHENDMRELFSPVAYYLVLFDFEDLADPSVINARIWEVDPRGSGFAYCLVDYYFNIRAKSTSGAPFNLWPFSLKFQLMMPLMIYHAKIFADNRIETLVFPDQRGEPVPVQVEPLTSFTRATGFTLPMAQALGERFSVQIPPSANKAKALAALESRRVSDGWNNNDIVDALVEGMYGDRVAEYLSWLPQEVAAIPPDAPIKLAPSSSSKVGVAEQGLLFPENLI